jgi:hypothetical protein
MAAPPETSKRACMNFFPQFRDLCASGWLP